jgi:hypothetical protein
MVTVRSFGPTTTSSAPSTGRSAQVGSGGSVLTGQAGHLDLDRQRGGRLCARRQTDQEQPQSGHYPAHLAGLVKTGRLHRTPCVDSVLDGQTACCPFGKPVLESECRTLAQPGLEVVDRDGHRARDVARRVS